MPVLRDSTDQNQDLERRIDVGRFAVMVTLGFAVLWLVVLVAARDFKSAVLALLVVAVYSVILVLFRLGWTTFGRSLWLIAASLFAFLGLFFAPSGSDVDLLFLPMFGMPFIVFSWRTERSSILVFVAYPILLWMLSLALGAEAQSEYYFGIPSFSGALSESAISLGIWATCGALFIAELAYFNYLAHSSELDAISARLAAENANRAKSEFLANMSHEIRTPMNGVIGMIEVLETMEPTSEQGRAIGTIRNSAFSLLRIIDDILDAAKIEAGELRIDRSKTELHRVAEGVAETLIAAADTCEVKIHLVVDPRLPEWIISDSGRLRQIMLNLLGNAIKFSAEEFTGRKGEVKLVLERLPDDQMRISIIDNGMGMSPKFQEKLFRPFIQNEASTTRKVGGTGLGLVITAKLVELLGGTIAVSSTEGRGSEFHVVLPLIEADGPHHLQDISGLQIYWLEEAPNHLQSLIEQFFDKNNVRITFDYNLDHLIAETPKFPDSPIFILSYKTVEQDAEMQQAILKKLPDAKFIVFSKNRSDRLGLIQNDTYRMQVSPILPTDVYRSLTILSGRVVVEDNTHDVSSTAPVKADAAQAPKSILLVEDNEINRIVILKQLEILGYQAEVAKDGKEGLNLWSSRDFDLVLTDCHMPTMDGFEMTGAIRSSEDAKNQSRTPIIAITANALQGEADRCLASGMDDFLAKPVELRRLREKIERLIEAA